jgi:hypothetical protein
LSQTAIQSLPTQPSDTGRPQMLVPMVVMGIYLTMAKRFGAFDAL